MAKEKSEQELAAGDKSLDEVVAADTKAAPKKKKKGISSVDDLRKTYKAKYEASPSDLAPDMASEATTSWKKEEDAE